MKIKYSSLLIRYFIRNKFYILILLCFVIFSYYLFYYESVYNGDVKVIKNGEKNIPIFHMGYGDGAPISSFLATKKAIKSGAKILDLDVWLTKDSKVVVFHDKNLFPNTDGVGLIYENNLDYLNGLMIQDKKFNTKENIQLLENHIKEIYENKDIILFIEIKETEKQRFNSALDEIVRLILEYELGDRIVIFNKDPFNICTINNKNIPSGFNFVDEGYYDYVLNRYGENKLSSDGYYKMAWYKKFTSAQRLIRKFCQPNIIAINKDVNEDTFLKIKKAGYQFIIWSPNTKFDIEKAILKNPECIVTDRPKLLIDFIK